MRRAIKTSKKKIIEYWVTRVYEGDLSIDFAEAHERCWRCGYKCVLHRCHIIPHSLGGADDPSNLVLLCNRCHREAPNIDNPEFFWDWLIAQKTSFYDTYWIKRGVKEFIEVYNNLSNVNFTKNLDLNHLDLHNYLNTTHPNIAIHFGEGRINPSTIAGLILQYMTDKFGFYIEYEDNFMDGNPIRRARREL